MVEIELVRVIMLTVSLLILGLTMKICAQDTIKTDTSQFILNNITIETNDSLTVAAKPDAFKPDPQKAWLMAAIFPGVGQIYNRQYWKLPIVYGGFFGFMYAITWNNKNYQDYSNAYFDIMTDASADPEGDNPDSWHQSWQDFVSANVDPANYLHNSQFQSNLKRGKDFYRRNRDLSIILSVAFYLICVADSYVDAQMFDFDVSPDLSLRFVPEVRPDVWGNSRVYGFNVSMTF